MRKTTLSLILAASLLLVFTPAVSANWTGGHDVIGTNSPAKTWYFAEGTCRSNFDPFICLQNPGSIDANVTISYMKGDGSTSIKNIGVVSASSRSTINVKDFLGEGDDFYHDFSTVVNSDQPIIAERPMYFKNFNGRTGGSDTAGVMEPRDFWKFAEGCTRPGFDEYLTIMNPGANTATVNITYLRGNGENVPQTVQVAPNTRQTIQVWNVVGRFNDSRGDISMDITSNHRIVCERPMYFTYNGALCHLTSVLPVSPRQGPPEDYLPQAFTASL